MRRPARLGDYKVWCDRTGFRIYASEARMEWNGLFVRKESWESRQKQDYVKSKKDNQSVPIARTSGDTPVFL